MVHFCHFVVLETTVYCLYYTGWVRPSLWGNMFLRGTFSGRDFHFTLWVWYDWQWADSPHWCIKKPNFGEKKQQYNRGIPESQTSVLDVMDYASLAMTMTFSEGRLRPYISIQADCDSNNPNVTINQKWGYFVSTNLKTICSSKLVIHKTMTSYRYTVNKVVPHRGFFFLHSLWPIRSAVTVAHSKQSTP